MKLPLAYYGHSILRQKAAKIQEINDEIRKLIRDMIETMRADPNGVGLAAPQVHHSIALFIMQYPKQNENKEWTRGDLYVIINPRIISYCDERTIRSEGCLSIPKLYEDVERPLSVTFEAQDADGKLFTKEFTGDEARCFLHENDHLNGVLFIDRLDRKRRKQIEASLMAIKRKYNK